MQEEVTEQWAPLVEPHDLVWLKDLASDVPYLPIENIRKQNRLKIDVDSTIEC